MLKAGDLPESDSRRRFSARVADYVRYRPHYPRTLLETLVAEAGLKAESTVADIGSGTGLSTQLFLDYGCKAFGIEPNAEMRRAGDEFLSGYVNFKSLEGTAESTGLPDSSVDFVTSGQALHWFRLEETRAEFARILKPDGTLAFFWNTRTDGDSPFMAEHREIVNRHSIDRDARRHEAVSDSERCGLIDPTDYHERTFRWSDPLTLEQLVGRTISSSYMPNRGDPRNEPLVADLTALFARHSVDSMVSFEYNTELYFGRVARTA